MATTSYLSYNYRPSTPVQYRDSYTNKYSQANQASSFLTRPSSSYLTSHSNSSLTSSRIGQTNQSSIYQTVKDFSRDLDDIFAEKRSQLTPTKPSHHSLYSTPMKASPHLRHSSYSPQPSTAYKSTTSREDLYDTPLSNRYTSSNQKENITNLFNTPPRYSSNNSSVNPLSQSSTFSSNYNTNTFSSNLHKSQASSPLRTQPSSFGILPPNRSGKKYTLVLDLDETLIHTISSYGPKIRFLKRPGVQEFLSEMALYFEVVTFTAAMQEYADEIINKIDPTGKIAHRLYRQHLTVHRGDYVKDLSILGRDLSRTLIVDNLRSNFVCQPANGYEIAEFRGQSFDTTLRRLGRALINMVESDCDVRSYQIRI